MADSVARSRALLAWYQSDHRRFPWRDTTDPWGILVSEAMLQQTQAPRVEPAFRRFLDRFPSPDVAASARPADLLEAWSGLGYNRRALWLHHAARIVVADGWPETVDGLRHLPGVGPYTAAAVACFAFGVPVPTVDTNLRRVVSRWIGRPFSGTELTDIATDLIPPSDAADWNQAIMELGATVCVRSPGCDRCPVSAFCADPTVYEAPPHQARFDGSARQARGQVLRAVLDRPGLSIVETASAARLSPSRVRAAVESLVHDGLLIAKRDRLSIP